MLQGLYFGAPLYYNSPKVPDLKTPCVYIRKDKDRAVVIFNNAEKVARVDYNQLEWRYLY